MKKEIEIIKVDFSGGYDGVTAIYVDGKLHRSGDYYHDKIEDWFDGFVNGLQFAGLKVGAKNCCAQDWNVIRSVSEDGDTPPAELKDVQVGDDYPEAESD